MDGIGGRRELSRSEVLGLDHALEMAIWQAKESQAKTPCAAAVISAGELVALGINGPAQLFQPHCYCKGESGSHEECRVHAEWQAIHSLLMPTESESALGPMVLQGSQLLVVRLNDDASPRLEEPFYCGICSRIAKSLGVHEWLYELPEGWVAYDAVAYDELSRVLG